MTSFLHEEFNQKINSKDFSKIFLHLFEDANLYWKTLSQRYHFCFDLIQSSNRIKVNKQRKEIICSTFESLHKNIKVLLAIFKHACLEFFTNATLVQELESFHDSIVNHIYHSSLKIVEIVPEKEWYMYQSFIFFVGQKSSSCSSSLETCTCLDMYCCKRLYEKWKKNLWVKEVDKLEYWCLQRNEFSMTKIICEMLYGK